MTKKKPEKKSGKLDDDTLKALNAALNRRDSHFTVNGQTYRIAEDVGIIKVPKKRRKG